MASLAKDFLKGYGAEFGIDKGGAYRIVQLAAFNAHAPKDWAKEARENPPVSLSSADEQFVLVRELGDSLARDGDSIEDIVVYGTLHVSEELEANEEVIESWNAKLRELFADSELRGKWQGLFKPSHLLRNEAVLFEKNIDEVSI